MIDADSALGELSENEEHLTGLELQGSARIETPNARPGELKLMAGDVINLTYYENSDLLQSATVTGEQRDANRGGEGRSAKACCTPTTSRSGWRRTARRSRHSTRRDHVVFDLSAAKGQPAKKVPSNALVASGEAGKGLTAATFTEGVEY